MQRSRVLIPAAIVCVIAILLAGGWTLLRHNVTPENAARVRPGMPLAEVESILGAPGDYYRWNSPHKDEKIRLRICWSAGAKETSVALWTADDFAVAVEFDETDRVVEVIPSGPLRHGRRGFYINGKNILGWLGGNPPIDPFEDLIIAE